MGATRRPIALHSQSFANGVALQINEGDEDRSDDDNGNTGCDGHDASPFRGLDRFTGAPTGVTGSVEVAPNVYENISGLLANFPADGPPDNLLFFPALASPQGYFDASGVSFGLDGGGKVNLFLSDDADYKPQGGKQQDYSVYVANPKGSPDSRVVADIPLTHK